MYTYIEKNFDTVCKKLCFEVLKLDNRLKQFFLLRK